MKKLTIISKMISAFKRWLPFLFYISGEIAVVVASFMLNHVFGIYILGASLMVTAEILGHMGGD